MPGVWTYCLKVSPDTWNVVYKHLLQRHNEQIMLSKMTSVQWLNFEINQLPLKHLFLHYVIQKGFLSAYNWWQICGYQYIENRSFPLTLITVYIMNVRVRVIEQCRTSLCKVQMLCVKEKVNRRSIECFNKHFNMHPSVFTWVNLKMTLSKLNTNHLFVWIF